MEAFIHPKQAAGVVVQLAQAATPWTGPPPDDFPTARRQRTDGTGPARPAELVWVTHVVSELDVATPLFVGLLGAEVTGAGSFADHRWTELGWGGPMGIRLVAPTGAPPTPLRTWLGSRSGRVHHLDLTVEDPGGVPGAFLDDGSAGTVVGRGDSSGPCWVVPPEENAGMRLVLRPG